MKIDLFAAQISALLDMLPWNEVAKKKKAIRAVMEQRRRILTPEEVQQQSEAIMKRIEETHQFKQAQVVMVYYPVRHEVDLRPLIEKYWQEKTILLPVTHRKFMEAKPYQGPELMRRGRHNIPVPFTHPYEGAIDVVIVPGVSFDENRNRLGRGGGYYDRFLHKLAAYTIGVCFTRQMYKKTLPHQKYDKPVDMVITPDRTIEE